METIMRDILLQCAGLIAIAVALVHGVLGETAVFARATISPERLRTLLRLVWQTGTVAWIGCGVLLAAAPQMESEPARHWTVITAIVVFAFAACANALATRARHFGWVILAGVVVLAAGGY
jgi:cobalamin synthase